MPRPNLSRAPPRPLEMIPYVASLRTLADVRTLIKKHLPKDTRAKETWQHVEAELKKAAAGADTRNVSVAA